MWCQWRDRGSAKGGNTGTTQRGDSMELWARYNGGDWEHIDTSSAENPEGTLMAEYRMAYGSGWEFKWKEVTA